MTALNALGIAMYVVFNMFIPIRVVGNYFLCLGYVVIVAYPYLFGVSSGVIVGFFGTLIYCLLEASFNGIVGWTLGNMFIGFVLGIIFSKTKKMDSGLLRIGADISAIVLSCAVAFLLIKPLSEVIMFQLPYITRFFSNLRAFFLDCAVMLIGYPLARYFEKKKLV